MTRFTVHGIPGSAYVRTVLAGLEEKGADYLFVPLAPGEHRQPQYRALHPFARMPAFADGDFRLYESQAILRYIDRILPEPALTPADPRREARMNQIVGITDWYVFRSFSAPIAFQRVVAPRFGLPVDEEKIAAALPEAEICIAELAHLLGDQPYMAGDAVSIADLMLAPQLTFLPLCAEGRALAAPYPALSAWIDRMEARESMKATTWDRLAQQAEAKVA